MGSLRCGGFLSGDVSGSSNPTPVSVVVAISMGSWLFRGQDADNVKMDTSSAVSFDLREFRSPRLTPNRFGGTLNQMPPSQDTRLTSKGLGIVTCVSPSFSPEVRARPRTVSEKNLALQSKHYRPSLLVRTNREGQQTGCSG